jgi:molybdopterin-guanine dinucleotide biosynthesis protein A
MIEAKMVPVADVAGILLTGGASLRMGTDKALLKTAAGETWAGRAGGLLAEVAELAIEVGPGWSGLEAVQEPVPGSGPLVALGAGARWLADCHWAGPAIVLSTDLPHLNAALLAWLAGHPFSGSVVPLADGRPQPLCARYSAADLCLAAELAAGGCRAMRDLLARISAHYARPEEWARAAGDLQALADADEPADLERLR